MMDPLHKIVDKIFRDDGKTRTQDKISYYIKTVIFIFKKMIPEGFEPQNYNVRATGTEVTRFKIYIDWFADDSAPVGGFELEFNGTHGFVTILTWGYKASEQVFDISWRDGRNLTQDIKDRLPWADALKTISLWDRP